MSNISEFDLMSLNCTLLTIQQSINRYVCPTLLTFGLIGCLFNILLFSQKQFGKISCCLYFLSSSVVMFLSLIVGFVPHIYSVNHPNPVNTILIVCKIRSYLNTILTMIYRWLMTMACIDRCILSSEDCSLREYSNPHIAYSIIKKIFIIWIFLPVHHLLFLHTKWNWCINSTFGFAVYNSLFTFILGGILPISIMVVSVMRIRSNLASKQARRYRSNGIEKEKIRNCFLSERDDQIVTMLYLQVISYIIFNIPWMIYLLYSQYVYTLKSVTMDRIIIERFVMYSTELIIYLYPTSSFYIYTLTSNRFRRKLRHLISLILNCGNRHENNTQQRTNQCETISKEMGDQSTNCE